MTFSSIQSRVNATALKRLGNKGESDEILLDGTPVNGDFSEPSAQAYLDGVSAEGRTPQIVLPTVEVPAHPRNLIVQVSGRTFSVVEHKPDGFGMSTLLLEVA